MNPDLQAQLHQVRAPFARVHDAMYRIERMMRYAHWLRMRKEAPRNLLGSWTEADVIAEIELWRSFGERRWDDDRIVEDLVRRLQAEYQQDIEAALRETTDPLLATRGLPIWNADVGALVPQSLDVLRIYKAIVEQPEQFGQSYRYRHPDAHVSATLYFYPRRWIGIAPAVEDRRLADAFAAAVAEMTEVANGLGTRLDHSFGPVTERLAGEDGVVRLVATALMRCVRRDGSQTDEYLTMAGFRGRFFKMRVTIPAEGPEDRPAWFDAERFNRDLAMFLAFYGP